MAVAGSSKSLVASLLFMICMYTFFHNIHAQQKLIVAVPWKTEFTEFVSVEKVGTNFTFGGFCVMVFEEAIRTLNYSVNYIKVGNGTTEPSYDDELIRKIVQGVYICIFL